MFVCFLKIRLLEPGTVKPGKVRAESAAGEPRRGCPVCLGSQRERPWRQVMGYLGKSLLCPCAPWLQALWGPFEFRRRVPAGEVGEGKAQACSGEESTYASFKEVPRGRNLLSDWHLVGA